MITTNLENLKIYKLTQEQYDTSKAAGTLDETALYATPNYAYTVTLSTSGWSNKQQTVTATGITSSSVVFVAPAPTDTEDYTGANIICTAQSSNALTFSCGSTPTKEITVNVVVM